jgi:dTDP-glucose pyrophosphorylase/CBS domain-containing protein
VELRYPHIETGSHPAARTRPFSRVATASQRPAGRPSYQIAEDTSLRGAMVALNEVATGLVFVTNAEGVLTGVVSDGDIRRAILRGTSLDDPVRECMTRNYRAVSPEVTRSDVLDLMQAYWLKQVPIIDAGNRLLGVHLLHEMLGHVARANWAVVLAGGRGTRMRPLTDRMPKPMALVAGRPILERIVLHLMSFGVHRIFLAVNYRREQIMSHFGDGSRFGCRIEYLEEEEDLPLGSAGGLSLLPESPQDPVLVMNGDLVTQANVADMLRFHERGGYLATMAVSPWACEVPYGCVTLERGVVTEIDEKPTLYRNINAGVYVLSPQAVARVPRAFYPITDLFAEAIAAGERIGGFMLEGEWLDVGRIDQLHAANGHT